MDDNKDVSIKTLEINDDCESGYKKGSLKVMGGSYFHKNIFLNESINTKNGSLLFNNDGLDITCNLYNTSNSDLGSNNHPWNNIWCDEINVLGLLKCNFMDIQSINVSSNIYLGSSNQEMENGRYKPVLSIEEQNINLTCKSININDVFYFDNEFTINAPIPSIKFNDDFLRYYDKKFILSNDLLVGNNGIIKTFKKYKVADNISLVFDQITFVSFEKPDLTIKISNTDLVPGICKKIILYKSKFTGNVDIGDKILNITNKIELLFDGKKWIQI